MAKLIGLYNIVSPTASLHIAVPYDGNNPCARITVVLLSAVGPFVPLNFRVLFDSFCFEIFVGIQRSNGYLPVRTSYRRFVRWESS
jgi:hypothetical protein